MIALYILVVLVFLFNFFSPVLSLLFILACGFFLWDGDVKRMCVIRTSLSLSLTFFLSNFISSGLFLRIFFEYEPIHGFVLPFILFYSGVGLKALYRATPYGAAHW